MLLSEAQIAQKIGFGHLTPMQQKRRVRKLITDAGLKPKVFREGTVLNWYLAENQVQQIILCPLKSTQEKALPSGMSEERLKELKSTRQRNVVKSAMQSALREFSKSRYTNGTNA